MIKYIYFVLIITLLISCNQNPNRESVLNEENKEIQQLIDSAANRLINEPLINSTSIGLIYNKQEYIGHYGELEKGKNNSPTNNTVYEIGSLSKVLTGTLMANAVLEEKLNLEDKVSKYLKKDYPNLAYENQPVKIKHLLTHSSGLPNVLPLKLNSLMTTDFLKQDTPSKIDSILKDYSQQSFLKDLHKISIDTVPGLNYSYSTAGTELAAHILENVYETEFEKLLTEFLSNEVGMEETFIALDQNNEKNLALGYHADHPDITLPMGKLPWGAGGGIKSTVPDMIKFIHHQLENNEVVEESHKVLVDYTDEVGVAYFWEVDASQVDLGKYYSHHGGVPRSQCFLFILPKYDLGIFLITNQSGKDTAPKMKKAIDEIIDGVIKHNEQNLQ
ncbi:serine hydrolase domain-containing protein [Salegentibacter flavus]|uniref:Beta-lactamase n=1 Tax=Salegentibacter flavus TaxID=287099 RepID=A0A1I4YH00_9FLAO|nr:serine hydrolase domain-containing protein [Salegentibacter flavus]SFN37286.1 CubicO group peptidase, beta-lactamase class C family [Salegentibacter flavus]